MTERTVTISREDFFTLVRYARLAVDTGPSGRSMTETIDNIIDRKVADKEAPVPTVRPHLSLTGIYVADDLFEVESFGQAMVPAESLEEAMVKVAARVEDGTFAHRPKEA